MQKSLPNEPAQSECSWSHFKCVAKKRERKRVEAEEDGEARSKLEKHVNKGSAWSSGAPTGPSRRIRWAKLSAAATNRNRMSQSQWMEKNNYNVYLYMCVYLCSVEVLMREITRGAEVMRGEDVNRWNVWSRPARAYNDSRRQTTSRILNRIRIKRNRKERMERQEYSRRVQ